MFGFVDDLTAIAEDELLSESADSENVFTQSAFSNESAPAVDNIKFISFLVTISSIKEHSITEGSKPIRLQKGIHT